jgi:hypothetical protein
MNNDHRRDPEKKPHQSMPPQNGEHMQEGMRNKFIGGFELTDAIRPAPKSTIRPKAGYRHEVYVDPESQSKVPVIMSSAPAKALFPLFLDLIRKLGPVVDVVLESSHEERNGEHIDLYRESIEMPILMSVLMEYEDLLVNDGCTGIAVLNPQTPQEVQFEEHKLLIMYGSPLEPFEFVLESHGLSEDQSMKLITEGEHIHSSTESYYKRFHQLRTELGLDAKSPASASEDEQRPYQDALDPEEDQIYEEHSDIWRDSYNDDPPGGLM